MCTKIKFYFTLFYMIFYVKICSHLFVEKKFFFSTINSFMNMTSNDITYCQVHNNN